MTARPENVGIGQKISKGMPWLDDVAATMEQAFELVLGQDAPRGPRDFLYGTWLGHSLHAAVITVPVGSWSAAMLFDLMGEERAADLSLGLGLVGAAGAAVTGAALWQDTTNEEAPRRLGALHAMLNVAATTLMAGSWLMRQQGQRGVGVNHAAFQKPPTKWTDVAAVRGLVDGKPRRVEVDGTPVLLLRQGDRIQAIGATCPHLGGPLDEGTIEGDTVTCPWHGSVFSLDNGSLIHGPAMMPVAAYEVRVEDGRVAIRANAEEAGAVLSAS